MYNKFLFLLTGGGCFGLYLELKQQKKINSDLKFKCSVLSEKIYSLEANNLAAYQKIEAQQKLLFGNKNVSFVDYLYNNLDPVLLAFGVLFCLGSGYYLYNQMIAISTESNLIIQKLDSLKTVTTVNINDLNTKLNVLTELTNGNMTILNNKINELVLKQDYQIVSFAPVKNLLLSMSSNPNKIYPLILKIRATDADTGYTLAINEVAQNIIHFYTNVQFPL
jgi:hypothetical protein